MKETGLVIAIIFGIIGLILLWKWLKPYIIKYDTTILFTGGLGSGKTLESVKKAIVLVRKNRFFKYYWFNFYIRRLKNPIRTLKNKHRLKKYNRLCKKDQAKAERYRAKKPLLELVKPNKKPMLYSNIPIRFRTHSFGFNKEWARELSVEHIILLKEINEYSVVLIDELPQFLTQFDWNEDLVQTNVNEWITYFRHYIGGHLIINAQSEDEIECHIRRKLNIGIWCFDFHNWFNLFYTNRMADFRISENVQTMNSSDIEENTRIHFGLFPRKCYDSRCYKPRYKEIYSKGKYREWKKLQTNKVLRLRNYVSPLDTKTTDLQKEAMLKKAQKLERNEDK